MSAVRLIVGWLLVLVGVIVPLAPVETSAQPVVDCGGPAVRVMFDAGTGPRAGDCSSDASSEVLGSLFLCLLPGAALVAGRRLRRRALARQLIDMSRMEESGVWRFRSLWRWAAIIFTGLPLEGLAAAALFSGDPDLLVVAIIVGVPCAAYGYLAAFRPRVELTHEALVVVNPLSTRRVPWADLVAVQPGYWGTRLTRRDGSTVNLWAGQKSNWAVMRGRRARADAMCEAIANRAHITAGNLDPTIQLADPTRSENRRRGLRNMAVGLGVYALFLILRSGLLR